MLASTAASTSEISSIISSSASGTPDSGRDGDGLFDDLDPIDSGLVIVGDCVDGLIDGLDMLLDGLDGVRDVFCGVVDELYSADNWFDGEGVHGNDESTLKKVCCNIFL